MIATGLLSFGRRIRERALRRRPDASWSSSSTGELGRDLVARSRPTGPQSDRSNWSTRGIAHLAKLVQPFLLAEAASEPASALIDVGQGVQCADGRMPTDPGDAGTMLHPHLYAAEGLWMWGSATGDEDALDRARASGRVGLDAPAARAAACRVPRDGRQADRVEQFDVTAQAVRLALLLDVDARRRPGDRAPRRGRPGSATAALAMPYQPAARRAPSEHLGDDVRRAGARARNARRQAAPLVPVRLGHEGNPVSSAL